MSELTQTEKYLSLIACIVVITSITLALCIGFILPYHWISNGYVNNRDERSREDCQCESKRIATKYINCIPRTFYNRVMPQNYEYNQQMHDCRMIQEYPYVASLNIAAYDDNDGDQEKRLACTGTILSREWVLIGVDCVSHINEFSLVKLRVGSEYWSKGGKEYQLVSLAQFGDDGPMAVKLSEPLTFGKYVRPVKLSRHGKYTIWFSAVSVGWTKGGEKLSVQKWTITPCTDHCGKGEVMGDPTCSKHMYNRALVAENTLLVGIQEGICKGGDSSNIMYVDVQTEDYQTWLNFLVGEHNEAMLTPFPQSLERDLMGTTASPINIYEHKECVVRDSSNLDTNIATEDETATEETVTTELSPTTTVFPITTGPTFFSGT